MAETSAQTGFTTTGDTPVSSTPTPQNSIYAAFARVREVTFAQTVDSKPTTGSSSAARGNLGHARQVPVNGSIAFDQKWVQRMREATGENTRLAKASPLEDAAVKTTCAPEPNSAASPTLLRNLTDRELAHHLSQQRADFTLQEVARRLHRLMDQLNEARRSQCQECGAFIQESV